MSVTHDISFDAHGLRSHYRLTLRPGSDLVVLFPSLRERKSLVEPYYTRLSWNERFKLSCLYVSDPDVTANPQPRGTWFQGRPGYFGIERIAGEIAAILDQYRFEKNRTVLYGSSHGGFAALAAAAYLPGARVLAECPQIKVLWSQRPADVKVMASLCYGADTPDAIDPKYRHRLDIAELFEHRNVSPSGRILLRASDTYHITVHLAYFRQHHPHTLPERIIDDSRNPMGHGALPQAFISRTLRQILST